jgi:4-oxalocrotonate tautomerase
MPHIIVKMVSGRSEEAKQDLAEKLAKTLMETLNSPSEAVSVAIEDIPKERWAEAVYVPDIQQKADLVYRKPGYDPFK